MKKGKKSLKSSGDKTSRKSVGIFLKNLSKKQKITGIVILAAIIILAVGIPIISSAVSNMIYEHDYPVVATREDFIGKTFAEAKKLADEKGIRYDINNGNGIYDWESEDTQIMNWVTTVYDEKDDFVREYNQYTSHGFQLRKGWRISMGTDVKTDKQKADEEVCKAKEGYTFTYKDGKVDCHKTQETLCKEKGGIWSNSKCKTQEEIEAEEKAKQEEAAKKAEEERKKQEESAQKAEEKHEAEETEQEKPTENSASSNDQPQASSKEDNGETLPDDIDPYDIKSLCERGLKAKGYSSSISVTNHYAMGYPPYIYVIVGTTSGLQVQCQANWQTWTVKSLRVGGNLIYGE